MSEVSIARRFRGPASSGNGGYACGLLGRTLGDSAEVTLRLPPPLETPLRVEDGRLLDGDKVIAEGAPAVVEVSPPPPPSLEQARAARPEVSAESHFFPECFVCGPLRQEGDGLRIFGAPVEGHQGLAGVWEPQADPEPEIVWAAMDCMTGWCVLQEGPCVLARLAVSFRAPVLAGPKVVHAWATRTDGRKRYAEEALYDADGRLLAVASALWIALRDFSAFEVNV